MSRSRSVEFMHTATWLHEDVVMRAIAARQDAARMLVGQTRHSVRSATSCYGRRRIDEVEVGSCARSTFLSSPTANIARAM